MWILYILAIPYAFFKALLKEAKTEGKKWKLEDWNSKPRKKH